ncbi:MAG: S9 family peptidase [Sulfobacillus acidophilus]|uniref:S9 family peptidase n=1 Tax=Sulfobacillus acidophilus TaxID=53633 RepID=A0A2T2WPC3_9FIRM|nr:MAG: S9 family peptidase [Sulfobacillus acidophilus]
MITIQDVTAFPRPGMRIPGSLSFSEDGTTLYYLFADKGTSRSLWAYELRRAKHQLLAEPPALSTTDTYHEEMLRQRARLRWDGIANYDTKKDVVLISYRDRVYISRANGPLRAVPETNGAIAASLAPDGKSFLCVMEGDLCQISLDGGTRRWLTRQAQPGISYGVAEYVAQEELDRHQGYWLSPDGAFVALTEVDERHIPEFPIIHQGARGVWPEWHRYPFVGSPNARVRLGVKSLSENDAVVRWLDLGGSSRVLDSAAGADFNRESRSEEERYLIDVLWTRDRRILVLTLSRRQRHLAWDAYSVEGTYLGRLYEEVSGDWIERPGRSFVTADNVLVSTTERNGLRRLLVVDGDGAFHLWPNQFGDRVILEVLAINEESHEAWLWATRNQALERMLVKLNWVTGHWIELTPEPGWHEVVVAPGGKAWVDQWSTLEKSPQVRLVRDQASETALLMDSTHSNEDLNLNVPELFSVVVGDAVPLNGLMYCPLGEAPARGWPLVVFVYGGPHAQRVALDWGETVDFEAQYLTERGFAVMKLDNRGSANRGHQFVRPVFERFGEVELADQIAGVRYVAQRWPVDLRRIGIYGWSYGGYMTLRALFMAPEIFRVGVAGAPVTDFRWYDTAYTERFLGTDSTNRAGYDATALLDKAKRLQGKLLLIHGLVDENVHFRHSAALIQALIDAGRDFDLLVLPESRHMVSDTQTNLYQKRKMLEYFERHL